jgi:hypothetical protein
MKIEIIGESCLGPFSAIMLTHDFSRGGTTILPLREKMPSGNPPLGIPNSGGFYGFEINMGSLYGKQRLLVDTVGFSNRAPLQTRKNGINQSYKDNGSCVSKLEISLPSSFLYPNTLDPLGIIFSFGFFLFSIFLVHIAMSLLLFNSAFKIFQLFFFGELLFYVAFRFGFCICPTAS